MALVTTCDMLGISKRTNSSKNYSVDTEFTAVGIFALRSDAVLFRACFGSAYL